MGVSNSLNPGQAQHMIGSDFGSNCLERLSADDANRQRVVIWELGRTLSMYAWLLI